MPACAQACGSESPRTTPYAALQHVLGASPSIQGVEGGCHILGNAHRWRNRQHVCGTHSDLKFTGLSPVHVSARTLAGEFVRGCWLAACRFWAQVTPALRRLRSSCLVRDLAFGSDTSNPVTQWPNALLRSCLKRVRVPCKHIGPSLTIPSSCGHSLQVHTKPHVGQSNKEAIVIHVKILNTGACQELTTNKRYEPLCHMCLSHAQVCDCCSDKNLVIELKVHLAVSSCNGAVWLELTCQPLRYRRRFARPRRRSGLAREREGERERERERESDREREREKEREQLCRIMLDC